MRVAVLEFDNASSEAGLEALGKGLQSMVTTDLSKVGAITLVERARLQEILSEQKLTGTGLIDKATAARIGKLAGASHLLAGTYTVVGSSMRLDARLFSVAGGDVLLAEDMAGERDAFFELEKALVGKLVSALGVKLDPKERAGIARIHTADFGAFKSFSQGVMQFDQQRYDDAMESLRTAMKIDGDFGLARVTLGEYEALVAKIRDRAQKIDISQRELAQLEEDKDFHNDSQVAKRLVELAEEKGDAKRQQRLAALVYLIGFYNPHARNHGRISRFQDHFDQLVVRRRVAGLARRYFAEAQLAFPKAPLFTSGRHPPEKPEDIDKAMAGMMKALEQGMEHDPDNRDRGLLNDLEKVEEFAELMAIDRREHIKLHELALTKMAALGADAYDQARMLRQLSERYLEVGDVDAASGALARASAITSDPGDLESLARRIEELGKLSAIISRSDKKAMAAELIAARGGYLSESVVKDLTERGPPGIALLDALADARDVKRWFAYGDPRWFMAGEHAHMIEGEFVLYTGARIDGLESDDLRYYKPDGMSTKDVLVAIGRGPRGDVDATFTVATERAADFWPRSTPREVKKVSDLRLDAGRPELTFLVGLRDVDTESRTDPTTRQGYYPYPTTAYGVRLGASKIELVRLGEKAPSEKLRLPEMSVAVLAESAGGVSGDRTKVRVQVKGKALTVTVGGKVHKLTLPEAVEGFVGVHLRGQGYIELGDLALAP